MLISLTANGREKALEALKEKENEFYQRISTWEDSKLEAFIDMLKSFNGQEREE